MSSYIALDLDFLNRAPTIARAARVDEDTVLGGMSRLWAYCFREKTDQLTALHLRGLFHTDVDLSEPLCVFGALEKTETGFRVKGADRYLRITEGRSKGGRAASKNLVAGYHAKPVSAGTLPDTSSGSTPAELRLNSGSPHEKFRLNSGLSPTSEHRTPNTEHLEKKPLSTKVDPRASQVFDYWSLVMGMTRTVMSPKRQKAIEGRLADGYDVAALKAAVDGCARTPHNMGQNDRGTKFNDIELICRSPENVDRFMSAKGAQRPKGYDPDQGIIQHTVTGPPPDSVELFDEVPS